MVLNINGVWVGYLEVCEHKSNMEIIGEGHTLDQQDMEILNPCKKPTTPRRTLTLKEKVKVIEACEATGKSQRLLAAEFGISKTQVMEILRKKDSIRMVLNENLLNPDSKRLRLVKTRIKLMKEATGCTFLPNNGSTGGIQGVENLVQHQPSSDYYMDTTRGYCVGKPRIPHQVDKDQMGLLQAVYQGGYHSVCGIGDGNKTIDAVDHGDDHQEAVEETVLVSYAYEDDIKEGGQQAASDESQDSTEGTSGNTCSTVSADIKTEGGLDLSTSSPVFPSFTEHPSNRDQLLKNIKTEPQDLDYINAQNDGFSVKRVKQEETDCNVAADTAVNLSMHSHGDRSAHTRSVIGQILASTPPVSHSSVADIAGGQIASINMLDKGDQSSQPDSQTHGIKSVEKVRLVATCKGKTQSQLAHEFGISEVEVFEILRDRDEIEIQYRMDCLGPENAWQQQFEQQWRSKFQPGFNFQTNRPAQETDGVGSGLQIGSGSLVADGSTPSGVLGGDSDCKEKRKRKAISLEDKMLILQNKGSRSLRETADAFGIGKTTVLDIFRRGDEITNAYHDASLNPKRKKLRSWKNTEINYEMVDIAVFEWYKKVSTQPEAVFLSGPKVQKKAALLATELGITKFKASNGWLSGFCKRHCISFKGKRKKVSLEDAAEGVTFIHPDASSAAVPDPELDPCTITSTVPRYDAEEEDQGLQNGADDFSSDTDLVEDTGNNMAENYGNKTQVKLEPMEDDHRKSLEQEGSESLNGEETGVTSEVEFGHVKQNNANRDVIRLSYGGETTGGDCGILGSLTETSPEQDHGNSQENTILLNCDNL